MDTVPSFFRKVKNFLHVIIQVDVIIALGGFSALLLDPVRNEYVFQEVLGTNLSGINASQCREANFSSTGPTFSSDVSRWTLYLDMAMFIPASVAGILITSWSDKIGRKWAMVIPLVSMTSSSVILAFAIHYKWPLKSLFLVNAVAGAGGYYMTLLMQGFAYLSDITTLANRGMRFVFLDMSLGVAGGIGGVVSGFWVKRGFLQPVASTAIISGLALVLTAFLRDSAKIKAKTRKQSTTIACDCDVTEPCPISEQSSTSSTTSLISNRNESVASSYTIIDLLRSVWRVYSRDRSHCVRCHGPVDENRNIDPKAERCMHGGGVYPGRVWRMWFYLASYNLYMFANVGTLIFQTIYFLSPPLCFSTVLVGLQLGVKYIGVAFTPFLVLLYQRCFKMSNNAIIITSLTGLMASYIVIAVAESGYPVFIGTGIMMTSLTAKPFIQTQMSSLVSEWEQGSAFALLSCTEILTFLTTTAVFLTLYPATLHIYHGFCWLFAAGVTSIPILLITIIYIFDRKRDR